MRSELDALKGLRRGTVNLQAIESLVPHVLPRRSCASARAIPASPSTSRSIGTDHVLAAVREGRTDIGLAFYPPVEPELDQRVQDARAAGGADVAAPSAGEEGQACRWPSASAYPIALPLKNSGSRMLIDLACKAAGIFMMPAAGDQLDPAARAVRASSTTASPSIRACRLADSLRTGELSSPCRSATASSTARPSMRSPMPRASCRSRPRSSCDSFRVKCKTCVSPSATRHRCVARFMHRAGERKTKITRGENAHDLHARGALSEDRADGHRHRDLLDLRRTLLQRPARPISAPP